MKINKHVIIAIVYISIIVLGILYTTGYIFLPDVKPGQVWVSESSDPFNPSLRKELVLEVKDGWVKHVSIEYADRDDIDIFTWTSSISWFTMGAKLEEVSDD